MKKQALALLPLIFASYTNATQTVVIGGFKYTITDFLESSDTHRVARIDVVGDDGVTPVNFNITAKVGGLGKTMLDTVCTYPESGFASCFSENNPEINDFVFALGLTATCIDVRGNRLVLDQDKDEENLYTTNHIINTYREVTLTIDKQLVTQNQCDSLELSIRGTLNEIQQLDLSVILFNEF